MSFHFMAKVTILSGFGAQQNLSLLQIFPISYEVVGPGAIILVSWILSFKPAFSLSSFTLKKPFSSSLLSSIWYHLHIWGCCYFSLHSWVQLVTHPVQHFARCTLHISLISRETVYSLIIILWQFWTSPLFMSGFNCCFSTCIQVSQEASKVVWYSHFFKNFPQLVVIHTEALA